MYKAIYDYAREHNKAVIKNRRMLQIAGYIVLDKNGKFERVEAIPQKERKEILCPYTEEFYQSNMSNPICEKLKNILPTNANTEESKQPIYHQTWIEIMKEGVKCGELMGAIYNFIIDIETNEDLEKTLRSELSKTVIKDNEFVSFFVGNDNVVESSVWEEWFDEYMYKKREARITEKFIVISSLSGEKVIPISGKEKYPSIGAKQMGTGCSVASFAEESFKSYGLKDALNTPMAKEEADMIRAGIEYLLNSDHNHSDEFSLLYWYTGEDDKTPDILGRALNRNGFHMELEMSDKAKKKNMSEKREMNYQEVLESVFEGVKKERLNTNGKYYIVKYTIPMGSTRVFFTDERVGTYKELYDNLNIWYKDSRMDYPRQTSHTLCNIYGILIGLLGHKDVKNALDEAKSEFGEDISRLLDAIFQGKQLPKRMYYHALNKFTQSVVGGRFNDGNEHDQPTRIPLQIIKTYLIREGQSMDITLNESSKSVAYQCGRWLATMDYLQKKSASGKVGVTLGQKFYKAAKRQPAKILTMVTDYKEIYLGRILNEGLRIYFEKQLGEISEKIGESFPEKFSIEDQGAFDMGYAQQHQSFFKKDDVDDTENVNEEED